MEIKNRRSHADGVECGVCVDTSGDAEPNADAMTPDAERSFRLYAAGLDMPGGTIRRVGQVIARDLLAEIDRLRGELLAYVAEADEAAAALRRTPGIRSGAIAEALVRARADEDRAGCAMRPEREREIRDLLADAADLLAELDHLRRLPVIAMCGKCGWHRVTRVFADRADYCGHHSARYGDVGSGEPPPDWCPLRGAR